MRGVNAASRCYTRRHPPEPTWIPRGPPLPHAQPASRIAQTTARLRQMNITNYKRNIKHN